MGKFRKCPKPALTFFEQKKGVSIVAIGVGKAYEQGDNMKDIAGKKGKVLLYPSLFNLSNHIDQAVKEACSKFTLFIAITG